MADTTGLTTRPGAVDVDELLHEMTLVEKAAQMAQVELGSVTPDEVAAWGVGSVLSGGGGSPGDGSPAAWRDFVTSLIDASRRSRLGVPLLYGSDAVHGHNNVRGATIFPHHIGLGAAGSSDLVCRIARASALETAATGVRWTFAPCLAVPGDIRWGRCYEGFSQDPDVVSALGAAAVEGWHGDDLARDGVLACAKHFVGEGAMVWGTAGGHRHPWTEWWNGWGPGWQIDHGDVTVDEAELRRTHLAPFVAAIEAGVLTVMAGYASWHGERMHGHRRMLTDVLKGELGFPGFVISDWMGVDQLADDYADAVALAVNAGIDMVMVPFDLERFVTTVVALVETGRVPAERVDDAVRRILSVKARLGLFGPPPAAVPLDVPLDVVGCDEHRRLARLAARSSAVPVFDHGVLPIPGGVEISAAGPALDDIGIACGGWTVSWQGSAGPVTDGRTVLDGLRRIVGPDRVRYDADAEFDGRRTGYGVVAVHELPYVEGGGDCADPSIPPEQLAVVRRLRDQVDHLVVLMISGRPMFVEPLLDIADAIVACWLPGSEADGVADVLLGVEPFTGRLPVAWPSADIGLDRYADDRHAHRWPIGHTALDTPRPATIGGHA